ncbi:hypothetical protein [Micromonospora sp. NBC_00421]|uniref:hypothetical protein n=1 Tax=Micromonospora sp. NBC_00421 TaxID=2975976 RepID=UPI002E24B2F9
MKVFTIGHPKGRINQSIRDALGLNVADNHGTWIVAAPNKTFAVHMLRARGFPDWPSDGMGLIQAKGAGVDALTAAGRLDEQTVLVCPFSLLPGHPVAVVDKGGQARRIGTINGDRFTPDNDHLTAPERAALDAWLRGSADTTGMLYAVRAALQQVDKHKDARLAVANKKLHDAGEAILGVVENGSWATEPDPQTAERARRYVVDACYAIAMDAGLTEVAEACQRALNGEVDRG